MKVTSAMRLLKTPVMVCGLACVAAAQPYPPVRNPLDGVTPHALKAGEPSSTYALSGLDQLNYYDASVNVNIPLLKIGGKGEVSHSVTVPIKPALWTVSSSFRTDDEGNHKRYFDTQASINGYHPYDPGYGPGILLIKRSVTGLIACPGGGSSHVKSFVHLTYVTAGGSELELYDNAFASSYGIKSVNANCALDSINNHGRDNVFKDRDGSGITFVSDTLVGDDFSVAGSGNEAATQPSPSVTGTMYLRDGSRAVISEGRTMQKIDRNGNTISFCYKPCAVVNGQKTSGSGYDVEVITDALGRDYTFQYNISDGTYGTVDKIIFRANRSSTAEHVVRIKYGGWNGGASFGIGIGGGTAPKLPAAIFLQNASSTAPSYSFTYTGYAEVESITLPTGAKIVYTYGAGVDCNGKGGCYANGQLLDDATNAGMNPAENPNSPSWAPVIYRRLLTRVEKADGSNASRTTTISRPEKAVSSIQGTYYGAGTNGGPSVNLYSVIVIRSKPYVEVTEGGIGLAAPVTSRHYFYSFSDYGGPERPDLLFDSSAYNDADAATWSPFVGSANDLLLKTQVDDNVRGYPNSFSAKEYRTVVPGLQTVDRVFGTAGSGMDVCQENTTFDSVASPAGFPSFPAVTAGKGMMYDGRANRTDLYEYPYGSAPAISATPASIPAGGEYKWRSCPASFTNYARRVNAVYKNDAAYVNTPSHQLSLVQQVRIYDGGGGLFSQTDYTHDSGAGSGPGNLTNISQMLKDLDTGASSAALSESRSYDSFGNLSSVTDRRGKVTSYDWNAACESSTPAAASGAFLKRITFPTVNGVAQTTSWTYDCYIGRPRTFTGRDGSVLTFTYETAVDRFGRLTDVTRSGDGAAKHFTYFDPPGTMAVEAHSDVLEAGKADDPGDPNYVRSEYDGFGRLMATKAYGARTTDVLESKTEYDALGRSYRQSLPFKSDTTVYWKQTTFDALGRATGVSNSADGSAVSTFYSANVTITTDEALRRVQRTIDGLGRLQQVIEDPLGLNYRTEYTYDTLDNLTKAQQFGSGSTALLTRTFGYDSVKRLRTASNPESGLITNNYDGNDNLAQRVDGEVTATLTYDELNRLTAKSYSTPTGGIATPSAVWCYDGQIFAGASTQCTGSVAGAGTALSGKLTGSGSSVSSTKYEYDSQGRISASEQKTPPTSTTTYRFTYGYYANDELATETYPSNLAVTTCYDGLGRIRWISGQKTSSYCVSPNGDLVGPAEGYVSSAQYEAHGGIKQFNLGPAEMEATMYNPRLQPTEVKLTSGATELMKLNYGYGTANSGNVMQQTIARKDGFAAHQYYCYDGVNRLSKAVELGAVGDGGCPVAQAAPSCSGGQWCEGYGYDSMGNRTIATRSNLTAGFTEAATFTPGTNRMAAGAAGGTFDYDGRGNVKKDAMGVSGSGATYGYDGENRLAAYCVQGGTCVTTTSGAVLYGYDADGRRVTKGGGATAPVTYVYDAKGQLAAEYGISAAPAGTTYLTADALGSTRSVTDGSGGELERRDYYPFGGTIAATVGNGRACTGSCPSLSTYGADLVRWQFTGKERDGESGLDYFGARYFSGAQGRFTSPDEWAGGIVDPFTGGQVGQPGPLPYADIADPQTFNKYAYVRNNPLRYTDPDGHCFGPAAIPCAAGAAALARNPGAVEKLVVGARAAAVGLWGLVAAGAAAQYQGGGTCEACLVPAQYDPLTRHLFNENTAAKGESQDAQPQTQAPADTAPPKSKPERIAEEIGKGGYNVQQNPKTGTQEGNVTISHPSQPGTRVNVRVETHALKPGGPPVRHVNVETVKQGPKNRPQVVENKHIDH
jgi:RHS repeat-associated protein